MVTVGLNAKRSVNSKTMSAPPILFLLCVQPASSGSARSIFCEQPAEGMLSSEQLIFPTLTEPPSPGPLYTPPAVWLISAAMRSTHTHIYLFFASLSDLRIAPNADKREEAHSVRASAGMGWGGGACATPGWIAGCGIVFLISLNVG